MDSFRMSFAVRVCISTFYVAFFFALSDLCSPFLPPPPYVVKFLSQHTTCNSYQHGPATNNLETFGFF